MIFRSISIEITEFHSHLGAMNRLFVLLGVGLVLAVLGGGAVIYVVEFEGKATVIAKTHSQ